MAGKTFQFRLITPQGKLLDAKATAATIPAHDGLMGILPDRAAMVVKLGIGELSVNFEGDKGGSGGDRAYVIEEGFAQMVGNRLTVLTSKATAAETIVLSDAEAAVGKATTQRERERATAVARTARARAGKGI